MEGERRVVHICKCPNLYGFRASVMIDSALIKIDFFSARYSHRSTASEVSEDSTVDSSYERVDIFKRDQPSADSNGERRVSLSSGGENGHVARLD